MGDLRVPRNTLVYNAGGARVLPRSLGGLGAQGWMVFGDSGMDGAAETWPWHRDIVMNPGEHEMIFPLKT